MTEIDLTVFQNKKTLLMELQLALASLRVGGTTIAAVIHGEEKGKTEARRFLRRYKSEGRAKCILYGEHLHQETVADRYLSEKYPILCERKADGGVSYIEFN